MLLRNAVDAMSDGGQLGISARRVGAEVEIVCEDSGGGIAPDDLARIFSPAVPSNTWRGSGLRLTLARLVFHAHGAGLRVESDLGRGTKVTISFTYGTSA